MAKGHSQLSVISRFALVPRATLTCYLRFPWACPVEHAGSLSSFMTLPPHYNSVTLQTLLLHAVRDLIHDLYVGQDTLWPNN